MYNTYIHTHIEIIIFKAEMRTAATDVVRSTACNPALTRVLVGLRPAELPALSVATQQRSYEAGSTADS